MNLDNLKGEVRYINQNATRRSFEILIELLEKTGFVTALADAEMTAKMAENVTVRPQYSAPAEMETEDAQSQMDTGEVPEDQDEPDAEIVEQSEVETAGPDVIEDDKSPNYNEDSEPAPEDAEQTTDSPPDTQETMTITSDDVGTLKAEDLE